MKRFLALAVCIALFVLAFIFWRMAPEQASSPDHLQATTDTEMPRSVNGDNLDTAPPPSINPSPRQAARTTRIQSFELKLDNKGNLITGPEILGLFDTIARQQGQIPADDWKQSILNQYADQLGPKAHQQLQTLLNNYIEFNLALQLLPMDGVASLEDALQRVQQIRSDYLGQDSAALFSDWQQVESFTKQFVEQVVNNEDATQLKQSLQEQIYALPATVQPQAQKVLQKSDDLFLALGSSRPDSSTLKSIAEQMAAMALIQPDFAFGEPSQAFMSQYHPYSQAKQKLLRQGNVESESDPQLNQLRQQYFSGSELLRAKTLDRAEMY